MIAPNIPCFLNPFKASAEETAKIESDIKENTYQLSEGPGLVVTDKVNGIAKVTFLGMTDGNPDYEIVINGKSLISSAAYEPTKWVLKGSQKIILERQEGLIKISAGDAASSKEFWIDDSQEKNGAYRIYNYRPQEISYEEAIKKVSQFAKNHLFTPDSIVFNRHGVAAVGHDDEDYFLYWANPQEAELHTVPFQEICHPKYLSSETIAIAEDERLNFRHVHAGDSIVDFVCFLNGEPATEIDLKSPF